MIQASNLNESELLSTIGRNDLTTSDLDEIGYEMVFSMDDGNGAGLSNLWDEVKKEFRILLCTDDSKYKDVRKKTEEISPSYTTALIATISAALGSIIGVTAAAITPLIGLLLLALSRVGKNAICNLEWGA